MTRILPDIRDVEVSQQTTGRDERVYSLKERMPYRGRAGRYQLEVTRSEGETRYSRFADREAVKRYQGRVPPGSIYVAEGNGE